MEILKIFVICKSGLVFIIISIFQRFFGVIRQACGPNDHPDCPTFLQLYKLLSMYSIIKPPRRGNCTLDDNDKPKQLITISDLKSLASKPSEDKVQKLRDKINVILEEDEWEFEDVMQIHHDHSYTIAPIVDCIIYYVTGSYSHFSLL